MAVPFAGGVTDVGFRVAVTPAGAPEADSATAALKPETLVTVIVLVPLVAWTTEALVGFADKVKFGPEVTVSETVVLAVRLPEVPVMVIVEVPAAAEAPTVSVRRLVVVVGLVPNAAVTPVGRPEAARVTLPVNPLAGITVIVLVPLEP